MGFLILLAILACVTVIPVMVGARLVGAQHTGFLRCLVAVVLLAAVGAGVSAMIGNSALRVLVAAAIGAFFLAGLLGTTFWRGLGVSIIAAVVQIAAVVLFAGAAMMGAAAG